jgi:hypothetical protein
MPAYVVTMTRRIRCTAEVIVRAEDEATWEEVENASGGELAAMVQAAGGRRDTEAEYAIEQVGAA